MDNVRKLQLTGPEAIYFSYGQILVYDSGEQEPGSIWTNQHINQGFVRRPYSIGIRTLMQDGNAKVAVFCTKPSSLDDYARVISVPIELPTGILCIEGPDEYPIKRLVDLGAGVFQLICGQSLNADGELRIDIFVGAGDEVLPRSKVLKADDELSVFGDLIETGDAAE